MAALYAAQVTWEIVPRIAPALPGRGWAGAGRIAALGEEPCEVMGAASPPRLPALRPRGGGEGYRTAGGGLLSIPSTVFFISSGGWAAGRRGDRQTLPTQEATAAANAANLLSR